MPASGGAGIASLTTNQAAFAAALQRDLPGLLPSVAAAWAHAEVGSNNNLGIMLGPNQPASYATPVEGAAAAAALIKTAPQYAGIRASLKSTNPNTQATAIAYSPWQQGYAEKYSTYYQRVFAVFGLTVPGSTPSTTTKYSPSGRPVTGTGTPQNAPYPGLPNTSLLTNPAAVPGNVVGAVAGAVLPSFGKMLLLIGGALCIIIGLWIVVRHDTPATDPALLRVLAGGKDAAAVA